MRRIAVIGASGLVGSTLVERLLSQREDEVLLFIHSSGNAMRLARRGIELKMLDLLDAPQVESALEGVTHVVNCSRGGDEVMLTGLRNLLGASRKHRVQRFVHLSSVAVYGDPPPPESVSENAPTAPDQGTYGWTKLQQDEMVRKAAESGLPSIVLCPPNISGPYSYYLVALVDALRAGAFALLEGGKAPCNLVDVSNLCHAIELALSNGPGDGSRLFITDDEDTDWSFVVESVLPLAESNGPPPSVAREALSREGSTARSSISVVQAVKHLVSSDVREAMRKDPLWARFDIAMRRGVARLGSTVEDKLRLSVEGPTRVAKTSAEPRFNSPLCRQQLRGVRHSCDLAIAQLSYRPIYTAAESMEAFRRWFRFHQGMDTPVWPLIRELSLP